MSDPGRDLIELVVAKLEEVTDELVFIGGATIGLHLTEPQLVDLRPTEDVDTLVRVAQLGELEKLRLKLRANGFSENPDETINCRFKNGDLGRKDIVIARMRRTYE